MKRSAPAVALTVALSLPACSAERPPAPDQPYAGLHRREIAALSDQQVEDLLAGRGLGYALSAELNHYPGPMHVLELADELDLTSDQRSRVEGIEAEMHESGRALGRRLVSLERDLDQAFQAGDIGPESLERITQDIGAVEARLRAAHLLAHVRTTALLSPQQVHAYDRLRGYSSAEHDHAGVDHAP